MTKKSPQTSHNFFSFNFILAFFIGVLTFSFVTALNQNSHSIQSLSSVGTSFPSNLLPPGSLLNAKTIEFLDFFFRSQRLFHSQEQITEEDFENFKKLGFSGLWIALKGVPMDNPQGLVSIWNYGEGSFPVIELFFWNEIHYFFSKIAPEWTLARVLEYFLEIESVNQLTREEFYQYYIVLGFLKGPECLDLFNRMKTFLEILKFPETKVLSNYTLELLAKSIQITSEAIIIDLNPNFGSLKADLILKFIEKPLRNLAQGANGFKSGMLNKVIIHNFGFPEVFSNLLFQILLQNTDSLDHLELISVAFNSPCESFYPIRCNKLTKLRIHFDPNMNNRLGYYFEFAAHFNYKILDISNNRRLVKTNDQYDYFKIVPFHVVDNSWDDFLHYNSNLTCFTFTRHSFVSLNNEDLIFQDILRPLKNLEKIFINYDAKMNFEFSQASSPPSFKTLFIRDFAKRFNWSLLDQLPNLEYLNFAGILSNHQEFAKAIQKSEIQKLALKLSDGSIDKLNSEFFKSLNDSERLKNLILDPILILHMEFGKVDNFKFQCLFLKSFPQLFKCLPVMPNVRFLYLDQLNTSSDLKDLNGIFHHLFPNLEIVFHEKEFKSKEFDFGFKVIQSAEPLVRNHFIQLGCLSIEKVQYNSYYWSLE